MWRYCIQNLKNTNKILLNLAFQEGIQDGGVEIPGTESPSRISTITKLTVGVAFLATWK